jgi:hypothetical protein
MRGRLMRLFIMVSVLCPLLAGGCVSSQQFADFTRSQVSLAVASVFGQFVSAVVQSLGRA